MQLITIAFEQLSGFYPKLADKVKTSAQLMYTAKINDFSPAGLARLLQLYPIHVVRNTTDTNSYHVVAGLRQYELLCVFHALKRSDNSTKKLLNIIPVIEHADLSTKAINTMATCDIAGSAIIFSLGTKIGTQLTLMKDCLGPEVIKHFPKYQSGRRMVDRATKKVLDQ